MQEDALSLTVPRQRRRRRRKIEIEAERAAKRRNLMEMVAQLRETHAASESQSQAIDLTKVPTPNILAPVVGCLIRNGNNKQPKMSLLTKTVVVGCLGCASSPQGLSLINWLSQCPGDKPLPQSSDGLVAASLTLCTQSQWFNGG